MNSAKIKVAIYEDNARFRESLELVLSNTPECSLLGSFLNANNIHKDLKEIHPDVLLMDIQMPGINGIQAVKEIREYNQQLHIIILTVFDTNELVFDALRAGANGYLLKNTKAENIVASIREVYSGGAPMSGVIARKVLTYFGQKPLRETTFNLSDREREVMQLLVQGFSYKMIAAELFISIDTVRSHIKKIYEKLQVNSNIEAVKKAIDHKIV